MIKISYAIPVCNEHIEIQRLLTFLLKHKRHQDEIIILFDSKNGTPTVKNYLHSKSVNNDFIWFPYEFDGHFANMKNKLTTQCSGDYIFQIDADEIPNEILIENIPAILSENPDNEVYYVPRVNTVSGLTPEHIKKWNWNVDAEGRVNYPDYQMRIYKNNGEIKWRNKVHEVLENHKSFSALPSMEELSLYHPKDIKRQEKQNSYYNTL
jgi:hypothetical protein|tara:strand:- start:558 stop:1184 length:627 start_codon:yes stop_codon:yes gene_type:complete